MKATRIEWLHRLGIDVWKLRDSCISTFKESQTQCEVARTESANTTTSFDDKRESDESKISKYAVSAEICVETTEHASVESEPSSGDSSDLFHDSGEPSFELKCLLLGKCLMVFNPKEKNAQSMAIGIGRALGRYQATVEDSVEFRWPPKLSDRLSVSSSHSGWESARRAVHSLVKSKDWTVSILVSVGSDASQVTETLLSSDTVLLKLDEFPSNATSKRELWQRMTGLL